MTPEQGGDHVRADGENRVRLVWIIDVLPNELAGYISAQADEAAIAMKRALSREPAPA